MTDSSLPTGSQTTTYTFDELGNLKEVVTPSTTVNYVLDGFNRRSQKINAGTLEEQYIYRDQLRIEALLDATGALSERFVWGSKPNVPDYMVDSSGNEYKIISDERGSVRFVVDSDDGTIAQQIEYDEYGNVLSDSNPGFQPFYFAGCLYDTDTGLCHFGAREYDPSTGRFISKDPLLFAAGDTNLYGYTLNDPINLVDPSGLSPDDPLYPPAPGSQNLNPTAFNQGVLLGSTAAIVLGTAAVASAEYFPLLVNNRYLRIGEGKFPEPFSKRISIGSQKGNKIELGFARNGRIGFKIGDQTWDWNTSSGGKCPPEE